MLWIVLLGVLAMSMINLGADGPRAESLRLPAHARILFQGDSITDGNRTRDDDPNHILGHGYAFLLAATNGAALPEKGWTFLNRGVTGHKISDLAVRWQTDAIDLNPDLISILVGINDVEGGTTVEAFEATYDKLLTDTKAALPHVRLVLCEPFGTPAGWRKETWNTRAEPLKGMQAATKRLAVKHRATFVPLQAAFDGAMKKATPEYWLWDGIHPTYAGHGILAEAWTRAVNREAWSTGPK